LQPTTFSDSVLPDAYFKPEKTAFVVSFVLHGQLALTMLYSIFPATDVNLAICPFVLALTVELIVFECTDVLNSIRPAENTEATHLTLHPGASILLPAAPDVRAFSVDDTVLELATISRSVWELKQAFPVLLVVIVHALVFGTISPCFLAFPLFLSINPLSFESADRLALSHLNEDAHAMSSTFVPISFVDVTVSFGKLSISMRHIVPPVSFINCSVDSPNLCSNSISYVT